VYILYRFSEKWRKMGSAEKWGQSPFSSPMNENMPMDGEKGL
jgi:hypothetical protein